MTQDADRTVVALQTVGVPVAVQGTKFTDTLDIDQEAHRLYYGDNWAGGIDVFDISTPSAQYVQTVRMRGNIFGIGVAKNVSKVYAGLAESRVAIIDIDPESSTFHTVLRQVDTGGRGSADLLDYDPDHKKVYVANRNDGLLASIDATTDTVVGMIKGLGGGLEQPRYNPGDGMVYLAGNPNSVLYQIDPITDTLVETFELGVECHPNGMAINPKTNQAVLMTANRQHPQNVVWDLARHQVISVIDEVGSGDGALYNAKANRFFLAASGHAGGPVVGILRGDPVELLKIVPTARTGSWVGFDETNGMVYVPTIHDGRPALTGFALHDAE